MNGIKKRIEEKGYVIGSWINTASPIAAEVMAAAGFDFLTVDAEHSAVDLEKTLQIFQAIRSGNRECIPFIRLQGNTYQENKRFLDAGAIGVIAPLIKTSEEAALLIKSSKYPPAGERGVGFCRANGFGFDFEEYITSANEKIFVCVQIEHIESVNNIDGIFSVPGIDAAFIGPYDLSASMGLTANFEHPKYKATVDKIMQKCEEHNVFAGIHVVQPIPEEVAKRVREGFKFIAYSLDITMLGVACRQGLKKISDIILH